MALRVGRTAQERLQDEAAAAAMRRDDLVFLSAEALVHAEGGAVACARPQFDVRPLFIHILNAEAFLVNDVKHGNHSQFASDDPISAAGLEELFTSREWPVIQANRDLVFDIRNMTPHERRFVATMLCEPVGRC